MTTNSEAPESHKLVVPAIAPTDPAEALRVLLNTPNPKDETWQADAGRAVSILAVGFLSDVDDQSALRSVALIELAKSRGVKEARKREIKLSRWCEKMPPQLNTLLFKDEQEAALNALAKVTLLWMQKYVEQSLADLTLSEDFVPELLRWIRTTHVDNLSFTQDFYVPLIAANKSPERFTSLLKEATKLIKPSKRETAESLSKCVSFMVDALFQHAPTAGVDDKVFGLGVTSLLHLAQDQAAVAPAVLMKPVFVMALGRLSALASKGSVSKQNAAIVDVLLFSTISLLMSDMERGGSEATLYWRSITPTMRATYKGWDEAVASATLVSPVLASLTKNDVEVAIGGADNYAVESVFARLLPAWDAFVANLPDASCASSLSMMLLDAAETMGIVPLGVKGAVVSYDPLSHYLDVAGGAAPNRVRIDRPGVQVKRPDGSVRVLVAALVIAV